MPVPGDAIYGMRQPMPGQSGLALHRAECRHLKAAVGRGEVSPLALSWEESAVARLRRPTHRARLALTLLDERRGLSEATREAAERGVRIAAFKRSPRRAGETTLDVDVKDQQQLQQLIDALQELPELTGVHRV